LREKLAMLPGRRRCSKQVHSTRSALKVRAPLPAGSQQARQRESKGVHHAELRSNTGSSSSTVVGGGVTWSPAVLLPLRPLAVRPKSLERPVCRRCSHELLWAVQCIENANRATQHMHWLARCFKDEHTNCPWSLYGWPQPQPSCSHAGRATRNAAAARHKHAHTQPCSAAAWQHSQLQAQPGACSTPPAASEDE
jgi:hypothetical protein